MTMTYGDKFFFAIVSALVAAGCPASDDGGADTGAATEATAGTTGGSTPTTMSTSATTPGDDGMSGTDAGDDVVDDTADTMQPTTSDPTTGGPATGDASTGDASTGDASTGDPTTGGNNAGPCEPDALDDECAMCVKTNCCTQLEACGMDAGCTCFQDCVEKNPGVAGAIACGGECNVMIFGEGATADLVGCSSAPPCAAPCGV